jgi:uncharacterized protein YqfA (UPF0365 family)
LLLFCMCPHTRLPALFLHPAAARLINIMPPVKKQESLGSKLQIEQNLDNLELAPTEKELAKAAKLQEKEAKLQEKEAKLQEKALAKEAKKTQKLKTYNVTITDFSKKIVVVKAKNEEEAEEKACAGDIIKTIGDGGGQECEVEEVNGACVRTLSHLDDLLQSHKILSLCLSPSLS